MTNTSTRQPAAGLISNPWTRSLEEVLRALSAQPERGLSPQDARRRRRQYGLNCMPQTRPKSLAEILYYQFKSVVVLLLAAAALVSFLFGEWVEAIAIAVVIVINAAIGFFTELRAARSMEALRRLGTQSATVRRAGKTRKLNAVALVPGDIVLLEAGDIVSADLRLIETSNLQIDESALTGESVPVKKDLPPLPETAPLAERNNMAYKATAVTRGSGEGVVVGIGFDTELGRIATLVQETQDQTTPLEKRLDKFGQRLVWVTLVIAAFVLLAGVLRGKDTFLMIETAIALAVATIPEGLPIVATAALARGMLRMARRNALVNRLSAVETLGATNIICTDKTGTLTENRMTAALFALPGGDVRVTGPALGASGQFLQADTPVDPARHPSLARALEIGLLCNSASINLDSQRDSEKAVGDPMEVALLVAGAKAGLSRPSLLEKYPEEQEHAFDPEHKMMATVHRTNDGYLAAVKGAPEALLQVCSHIEGPGRETSPAAARAAWLNRNSEMAQAGLRVLALAQKDISAPDTDPYSGLSFVGLVGLLDPPREEVKAPIAAAIAAGIRIIMVTGDQAPTAANVAAALGLSENHPSQALSGDRLKPLEQLSASERRQLLATGIFSRVSPEQKLHLVNLHQNNRSVVAMTGDGVNDAPALKRADIGIAMGRRGTQVAREAADMVLLDDAFASIIHAVEQGRIIFRNIRRFVLYLLSCNVAEVLIVGIASLINAPLPILPLQILFLNLVTDVFPALALGVGKGEPGVMRAPPRDPAEPILARRHWIGIGGYGLGIALSVLAALGFSLLAMRLETRQAVTISFLTLAFAQLWHVFNMRQARSNLFSNDITANGYLWAALALCIFLLFAAVYVPFLAHVLKVTPPGLQGWYVIIGFSAAPLLFGQAGKLFIAARNRSTGR